MADRIHVHFESISSTNDFAKESVLGGTWLNYPLLISADEQTAGRGRHGKSFFSPKNTGVYMSYAYEKKYTEEELLKVTTKVAQIILPILQAHSDKDLHIKPINDIYIGDPALPDSRKIAGILTERVDYPERPGDYFIIVGIGINCFEFGSSSDEQSDGQSGGQSENSGDVQSDDRSDDSGDVQNDDRSEDSSGVQGGIAVCVPSELENKIGWLEPDCSIRTLIDEIADALSAL